MERRGFHVGCNLWSLSGLRFFLVDSIRHDHNSSEGFVEFFTTVHKTGRSAAKKSTLLPILAPAVGITGNTWVEFAMG